MRAVGRAFSSSSAIVKTVRGRTSTLGLSAPRRVARVVGPFLAGPVLTRTPRPHFSSNLSPSPIHGPPGSRLFAMKLPRNQSVDGGVEREIRLWETLAEHPHIAVRAPLPSPPPLSHPSPTHLSSLSCPSPPHLPLFSPTHPPLTLTLPRSRWLTLAWNGSMKDPSTTPYSLPWRSEGI